MMNRDRFVDAMNGLDERLFAEHIERKYPSKAQRIRRYVMAAAVYAAACLVVAGILPFIIRHGDTPEPVPGEDPIRTETYAISYGETTEITSLITSYETTETEYTETAETSVTETESSETTTNTEPPEPPTTTPSPATDVQIQTPGKTPAVTVHIQETEPPEEDRTDTPEPVVTTTRESSVTTSRKPVTTNQNVTYPDPYTVECTATSVTRRFYGCDYTLSVDKAKVAPGDIITVTVTLENKGQSRIDLYDYVYSYDRYNGYTHKNFLDRVAFKVGGFGAYGYSGEGHTKCTSLMPGQTMSYTTKFETTDADIRSWWNVTAELYYSVNGNMHIERNSLRLEHDGCVEYPTYVGYFLNPFDESKYYNMFKGSGEIVVTFSPETSADWVDYFVVGTAGTFAHDYKIDRIVVHEETDDPRVTISIFLIDTDEINVQHAVDRLCQMSKDDGGAIDYAYPVLANYFVDCQLYPYIY